MLAVNTMVRDIEAEKRERSEEKSQADALFSRRKVRIDGCCAALSAVLQGAQAAEPVPAAAVAATDAGASVGASTGAAKASVL